MALTENLAIPGTPSFNVGRLVKLQMGAMSPLWLTYAGMAAAGAATWNMTRWMRLAAPDIMVATSPASVPSPVETHYEYVPDPVTEAPIMVAIVPEPEPASEPVAEPEPLPVVEAVAAPVPVAAAPAPKRPPAKVKAKPATTAVIREAVEAKPEPAAPAAPPLKTLGATKPVDGRTKAGRAAKAAMAKPAAAKSGAGKTRH